MWRALVPFALGMISALSFVSAAFFLRFYRDTRDPLFAWFAAAFLLEGADRALFALAPNPSEADPILYVMRAIAYGLILIYQKNQP